MAGEPDAQPRQRLRNESEAPASGKAKPAQPPKQVYLRTVYPLNPGIPHFIDVPGGW